MAGLLDMFDNLLPQDENKRSAALQGLLSAGLGMMANSYNQGGRFAPAFGQGGLQGVQAYGNAMEQQQKQALAALQMQNGQQNLKRGALDLEKGGLEIQSYKDNLDRQKRIRDGLSKLNGTQQSQQPATWPSSNQKGPVNQSPGTS